MTTLSLWSNNTWFSHCQHFLPIHASIDTSIDTSLILHWYSPVCELFPSSRDMFRSCTCLFRTLRPPIKESLRRSFKRQTVEERVETEKGDLEVSDLWKPVLFSTAFTGVTFAASSIWQYESYIRNHSFVYMKNLKEEFNRFSQVKRGHYRNEVRISSDWIIKEILTQSTRNWPQSSHQKVLVTKLSPKSCHSLSPHLYQNIVQAQKWWHSLSETERLVLGIAFINTLVFCAWRVPSLAPVMHKYFACTATKSELWFWSLND